MDYFTASLPDFTQDRLDFSTLEQLPDSYVSEELGQTVSDIVYSCRPEAKLRKGVAGGQCQMAEVPVDYVAKIRREVKSNG